jgi:hypothetical protein
VKETGNYLLQIKTATNKSTAKFHITFNGVDKRGILSVPNTGDWQTWTTISIPVSLTAGTQVMKFYVDGNVADSYIFNFDKLILLGEQSVNFAALTKYISDIDFSPATSTSGLPITYSSSNASVATVVNGLIHIVGMGTSTITASQGGNELYLPATNVSQILTVKNKPTGLNDIISNSIHIYPNPVQDKAIVQLETSIMKDAALSVYNSIGILVMTQKIDSQSSMLDMSKLTSGIYYVRIMNGSETTTKLIIKK